MLSNVLYEAIFFWTKANCDGKHTVEAQSVTFKLVRCLKKNTFFTVVCLCKFPLSWREDYSASFQADLSSN